jgi:hypothetical protein
MMDLASVGVPPAETPHAPPVDPPPLTATPPPPPLPNDGHSFLLVSIDDEPMDLRSVSRSAVAWEIPAHENPTTPALRPLASARERVERARRDWPVAGAGRRPPNARLHGGAIPPPSSSSPPPPSESPVRRRHVSAASRSRSPPQVCAALRPYQPRGSSYMLR